MATSIFAAMTLGIGVNGAIQLPERFDQACAAGRLDPGAAADGPAGAHQRAAVSLGFGVLMLSQVPANARLGILLVLVNCLVVPLRLLPVPQAGQQKQNDRLGSRSLRVSDQE